MRKNFLKIACIISIAFMNVTGSIAQDTTMHNSISNPPPLFSGTNGFRKWSLGLQVGAMAPFSAVGGKNDFSNWLTSFEYGGYVKYQATHGFALQLDVLRGTLEANNDKLWAGAPPISPYSSFKTEVHFATSLSGVVTLGNISWTQLHTSIQPYVSIGGGIINFNPTLITSSGTSVNFKPDGSLTEFYVPVGFGIKANLSKSMNLDLGYTMAYEDRSNLDGYYRSPFTGDKFSYAHVGLEFILGNPNKPQLARHNPPAQLAQNMKDDNDAMRASLAASEERYNHRLAEMNRLREEMNRMKMDSDNDGVSDYFDKCPNTPVGIKVDGAGCPLPVPVKDTLTKIYNNTYVITEEDKKVVNEAVRNLEFEFAKSTIRPRSLPYLNRVADLLVKKGISLKLGGHTDAIGSETANMKLSKDRAESVKNYLISQGANTERIETTGFGESKPIATNKTAIGRQENRRVEFILY